MAHAPVHSIRGTTAAVVLACCVLMQLGREVARAQEKALPPPLPPTVSGPPTLIAPAPNDPVRVPAPVARTGTPTPVPAPPVVFSGTFPVVEKPRFHFKIDPNTPLKDLLPLPPT